MRVRASLRLTLLALTAIVALLAACGSGRTTRSTYRECIDAWNGHDNAARREHATRFLLAAGYTHAAVQLSVTPGRRGQPDEPDLDGCQVLFFKPHRLFQYAAIRISSRLQFVRGGGQGGVSNAPRPGPYNAEILDGAKLALHLERGERHPTVRGIPASATSRSARGGDPFAALPLVTPGQLAGRIRYLANKSCELREYDLETGTDAAISPSTICDVGWPVISPTGEAVAARDSHGKVIVERPGGGRLVLGKQTPRVKAPGNFVTLPAFSPDGRRIAYCTYSRTRLWTVVADSTTGRPLATIAGTCEIAFTAHGVAYLRADRLLLGGRTILRLRRAAAANEVQGNPPEGTPLAANPQGTLLALATRSLRNDVRVTIHVLRLDAREVASYRAGIDIPVGFQALAPTARSAVIWWGDILQLAAFGTPRGSLTLRYNLGPHSGDGERPIFPTSYSPDGAYAVMPRRAFVFAREPAPPPQPALILSGTTLQPLFRLPIDAQVTVWLEPAP